MTSQRSVGMCRSTRVQLFTENRRRNDGASIVRTYMRGCNPPAPCPPSKIVLLGQG